MADTTISPADLFFATDTDPSDVTTTPLSLLMATVTGSSSPSSSSDGDGVTGMMMTVVNDSLISLIGETSGNMSNMTGQEHTIRHYDTGEVTWILICTAVTWLMIPGVGFFYNGMAPSKSSLVLIMGCLWSVSLVSIQWYLIGYSLCLSNTGSPFIGNVDHVLLRNIGDDHAVSNPEIPALLVGIWYCLFAAITPTIILGGVAERARFIPQIVFIFLWSTIVFDFLTYWTWNPNGWVFKMGGLDFGGGTPVHISTGAAALAYALIVGKRDDNRDKKPHNMTHVLLGCCFIWAGWLLANGGSGLKPNLRAVTVFITTNMSASIGGVTWAVLDYRHEKKLSAFGFCCGVVCGLVAITPASGFVSPSSSLAFGFLGALICNLSMGVKKYIRIDDSFDVFCVHGIGGIVGNLLTGVFAQKSVAMVDGTEIEGGWLDGNWKQVGIQGIDTLAGGVWAFTWTLIILYVLNKIPGLRLRASLEDERNGLDQSQLGDSMYQHMEDLSSSLAFQGKFLNATPASFHCNCQCNHSRDKLDHGGRLNGTFVHEKEAASTENIELRSVVVDGGSGVMIDKINRVSK